MVSERRRQVISVMLVYECDPEGVFALYLGRVRVSWGAAGRVVSGWHVTEMGPGPSVRANSRVRLQET